MEFLSLYSLQVNSATSAMLRFNEIEDILGQLSHLTRKTLISFAYLPRFLTMELNVRLAAIPALAHTLDALKSGFATIIQPLVDYEFQKHKKLQLNLLFTLPEITYQHKGHCFGGPVSFDDLLLLTCDTQRFLLKALELEKCYRGTQRQFSENICSEDDLRSRIFGTFIKFLACLPLLGFSNI